jgi:hypothetical protein
VLTGSKRLADIYEADGTAIELDVTFAEYSDLEMPDYIYSSPYPYKNNQDNVVLALEKFKKTEDKIIEIGKSILSLQDEVANLEFKYLSVEALSDREYLLSTSFKGSLRSRKLIKELQNTFKYLLGKRVGLRYLDSYRLAQYEVKNYNPVTIKLYIQRLRELEAVQAILNKWN